jgi:hypothetical protein
MTTRTAYASSATGLRPRLGFVLAALGIDRAPGGDR